MVYDGQFYAITKSGASGCYRSVDNGATWTAFNDGLSAQNTFVQEEFHAGAEHLYIACALDCYRIPSLTTSITSASASVLPIPFPTVFSTSFNIDLSTMVGAQDVVLIDASGREVLRVPQQGGGVGTVTRGVLANGRYHCMLVDPNTGAVQSLGHVIAE